MGAQGGSGLDDQAVAALADRDRSAITAVYEALADPLFRYLRARCADDELAADMVEATFVELLQTAPRLEGGVDGLRRWMFTAARHNLLDELRKQRRRGDQSAADDHSDSDGEDGHHDLGASRSGDGSPDRATGPEEQVVAAERDAEVRAAMATLPDHQREVLELRFAAELSADEVGTVTGRSAGAVRVLQHRALRALSSALGERHPDAVDDVDDQVAGPVGDAAPRASEAPRGPPRPS